MSSREGKNTEKNHGEKNRGEKERTHSHSEHNHGAAAVTLGGENDKNLEETPLETNIVEAGGAIDIPETVTKEDHVVPDEVSTPTSQHSDKGSKSSTPSQGKSSKRYVRVD